MKNVLIVLVSGLVLSIAGRTAEPARPLTDKEAVQLTATANTSADHTRLAQYFESKAEKLETEAKEHADMAVKYRAYPQASETKRPGASDTQAHCQALAERLTKAALDARVIAREHQQMANR